MTIPPVLAERAEEARVAIAEAYKLEGLPVELREVVQREVVAGGWVKPAAKRTGDWLSFAEVSAFNGPNSSPTLTLEEEVKACFASLQALLAAHESTLLDVSHLTVYLSPASMALFPAINAIYATYFGTAPPTRACVSILTAPGGPRLKLGGLAQLDRSTPRKSLHVQSLSYWAAANIGPYSQAITTAERCFIAGQIALVPRSLTLPAPADFCLEAALSLQHVGRVTEAAREARWKGWTEGGACWIARTEDGQEWDRRRRAAERGWSGFLEEHDELYAPMVYVSAAALPKGAAIEWQVSYSTASSTAAQDDDDDTDSEDGAPTSSMQRLQVTEPGGVVHGDDGSVWMCSTSNGVTKTVNAFLVCDPARARTAPAELAKLGAIHSIRAFHLPGVSVDRVRELADKVLGLGSVQKEDWPPLSLIAVDRLSAGGEEGRVDASHTVAFWLTVSTL